MPVGGMFNFDNSPKFELAMEMIGKITARLFLTIFTTDRSEYFHPTVSLELIHESNELMVAGLLQWSTPFALQE